MKHVKFLLTFILSLIMATTCFSLTAMADEVATAPYEKEVAETNNLATSKYDWVTDNVATGKVEISETNGMTFENFTKGSSVYALYQTNKFNEFKYSMYAKLNLTKPSDFDFAYDHDYSNLYISFQINSATPIASTTCPWNGNKANFSICFENLQGYSKVVLYLNESFVGNGQIRQIVAENNSVNWNDGEYHWYELEFTNTTREEEYRGQQTTFSGKLIKFYFDGELALEYFQRNEKVMANSKEEHVNYDFTNTSGYIGFWPSSDFPGGKDTAETNCSVNIKTIEITSLDGGNTTPYEKCPVPDFPINRLVYTPAASYETDLDIEIKLDKLFSYEGEEEITYTAVCDGNSIGTFRNGYWVWTPTEGGEYLIDITASAGDKSVVNYLTINVKEAQGPVIPQPESKPESATTQPSKGCKGSFGGSVLALGLLAMAVTVIRSKKD